MEENFLLQSWLVGDGCGGFWRRDFGQFLVVVAANQLLVWWCRSGHLSPLLGVPIFLGTIHKWAAWPFFSGFKIWDPGG